MPRLTSSRAASFAILAAIYVAATIVGYFVYRLSISCCCCSLCALFIADVVATIFVWIFGLIFKNVSVYDPYWSVLPPIMMTAWGVHCVHFGLPNILLLIAVWVWGIRHTGNWAYTFRNLNTEDWRYTKYRTEQKPFIFQIINFFGLNMMPTIVVFFSMVPGLDMLSHGDSANWLTWVGFAVCLGAATIQLISDTQRHRFAKEHRGEVCKVGLWKHGRHPNYFGEISMWWGVWLMYVSVSGFETVWYLVGPVAMTCMFLFISIPLMENRQLKNKPAYAEYKKETRILI